MGICSTTQIYSGQLVFQIDESNYQLGIFSGKVTLGTNNLADAKYIFVNLVGIEAIVSKNINHQKQFLFSNLFVGKVQRSSSQHTIEYNKQIQNQWMYIKSNFCKVQNLTLSTTVYLECYLGKSKNSSPQSRSVLPNSRRIHLLKINQELQQFRPINLTYDPRQPGFAPVVRFESDSNSYRIGQEFKGIMRIDNTNSKSPIISNKFSIVQLLSLRMDDDFKPIKNAPQIMVQQMLDTLQCEKRIINISIPINQAFKDAVSYSGNIYRIQYFLQIEVIFDGQKPQILQQELYISDEVQ